MSAAKPVPVVRRSFTRRFVLDRKEDVSGTSGTGVVAEGACFSNGKVALNWLSHYGAVNVYDSMEVTYNVHEHDGRTKVQWVDFNDVPPSDLEAQNTALRQYINDLHKNVSPLVSKLRLRANDPFKVRADKLAVILSPPAELLAIIKGDRR